MRVALPAASQFWEDGGVLTCLGPAGPSSVYGSG